MHGEIKHRGNRGDSSTIQDGRGPSLSRRGKIPGLKFILLIFILSISAVAIHQFPNSDLPLSRKKLTEFPRNLGGWVAVRDSRIDEKSLEILQVDDYIIRDYRNSDGETIGVYIGYFTSQREGKRIHSPRQCLPGGGWMWVSQTVLEMASPTHNPEKVQINKLVVSKGLDRQLYLFWYHGRGRIYASEYWNKIYLIWDGLTKKRTDGALIRIHNSVQGNTDDALKRQVEFIRIFLPCLDQFIPK